MYISDSADLVAFVERAKSSSVLAIDTEFLREKTYYAQLCLLQMATDTESVIIDPFLCTDLSPIASLFQNQDIVKVFHASTQDIEILYHEIGVMPCPVFDTQIAATLLGYPLQPSYASVVATECGVRLKKQESFSDWSRRPLSKSQLRYAEEDVLYLPKVYKSMIRELGKSDRQHWLDVEMEALIDPDRYTVKPLERFRHLKRVSSLSGRQLSAARELAAWRENTAISRNMPRRWVITDEQIIEACRRESDSIDDLFMVRGLEERLNTREAREVVNCIRRGINAPKDTWPHNAKTVKTERNVDVELDLMNALVRFCAHQEHIAPQVLAPHDELVKLARGYKDDCLLLQGWRKNLIGNQLLDLLSGKISLGLWNGYLRVIRGPSYAARSSRSDT